MSNKAWARVLKDIFILHSTSHKISIITSSAKPGRYKLFPWIHPHTGMGCKKWCQLLKTAANWVIAGQRPKCWTLKLSTILQVWVSPQVSSSQSCWWEWEIYFFPNPGHRLAHPPVVVVPKAINHLKWIWWKVLPYKGGNLMKTREMEKERGKDWEDCFPLCHRGV